MQRETWDDATRRFTMIVTNVYANDSGIHERLCEAAQSAFDQAQQTGTRTRSEDARYTFADALKSDAEDEAPEPYQTLLTAAVGWIDWDDVADTYLCDVDGYEPCGSEPA